MIQTQQKQNLQPLVIPLADYVAATSDPQKALAEVFALLLKELTAIEGEARRHLAGGS